MVFLPYGSGDMVILPYHRIYHITRAPFIWSRTVIWHFLALFLNHTTGSNRTYLNSDMILIRVFIAKNICFSLQHCKPYHAIASSEKNMNDENQPNTLYNFSKLFSCTCVVFIIKKWSEYMSCNAWCYLCTLSQMRILIVLPYHQRWLYHRLAPYDRLYGNFHMVKKIDFLDHTEAVVW